MPIRDSCVFLGFFQLRASEEHALVRSFWCFFGQENRSVSFDLKKHEAFRFKGVSIRVGQFDTFDFHGFYMTGSDLR